MTLSITRGHVVLMVGRPAMTGKQPTCLIAQEMARSHIVTSSMRVTIHEGDLLEQNVDVIVNAWNRNIIPWWLLMPQGISGAIKRKGGYQPFRELARMGPIPLGGAVETSAGNLPFRAIIHVAGINLLWRSSERSIRACVRNALNIAQEKNYGSIAFPLIGAGTGGYRPQDALEFIRDEAQRHSYPGEIRIVKLQTNHS